MSATLPKFRHIKQSRGEILKLPVDMDGEEVHAVGTSGCRTCMCVYMRFEDETVFIAHMVAQLEPGETDPDNEDGGGDSAYTGDPFMWTTGPTRGNQLKAEVLAQLRSVWAGLPADMRPAKPLDSFVVCPAILLDGQKANGWWMKEAVQEFFGLEDLKVLGAHGFVAGPGVDTVLFNWTGGENMVTDPERGPDQYNWAACSEVEELNTRVFGFLYQEGVWGVCDEWLEE